MWAMMCDTATGVIHQATSYIHPKVISSKYSFTVIELVYFH